MVGFAVFPVGAWKMFFFSWGQFFGGKSSLLCCLRSGRRFIGLQR